MEIGTIAVIGAGAMGRCLACAALAAGYNTILENVLPERLATAEAEIRRRLNGATAFGGLGTRASGRAAARLLTAGSVAEACRGADLLIETLPEEMEMKIDVFCIFEKFAGPGAILATSAESFSVTEIASVTTRRERCVGLRVSELESTDIRLKIVRGQETSEATVEACREVGLRMGKDVVVVSEAPEIMPNILAQRMEKTAR